MRRSLLLQVINNEYIDRTSTCSSKLYKSSLYGDRGAGILCLDIDTNDEPFRYLNPMIACLKENTTY